MTMPPAPHIPPLPSNWDIPKRDPFKSPGLIPHPDILQEMIAAHPHVAVIAQHLGIVQQQHDSIHELADLVGGDLERTTLIDAFGLTTHEQAAFLHHELTVLYYNAAVALFN